ncbi:MAG: endonuclease V [Pyrodictiaceae archaeon]
MIASLRTESDIELTKLDVICAMDAAYSKKYGGVGVAIIYDKTSKRVKDIGIAVGEAPIPYIPGLLAFREAPLLYTAYYTVKQWEPNLIIIDGHGIAHPRRAGIATHIGVALGKPSIGVAKKRLYGKETEVRGRKILVDPETNERLAIIIERPGRRKLYISPGNIVKLETAAKIIIDLLDEEHKLPIPLYYADKISKRIARDLDRGKYTPSSLKRRLEDWL